MNDNNRKLIVVLGAGRTGTSLLMQILANFGMSVSDQMTEPSEQNIDGGYEDKEIYNLHSEMLSILNTNQLTPLPDNWQNNENLKASIKEIEKIIVNRIDTSPTLFGFKDPRTTLFLPIWKQIFNRNKILPTYLIAIRDPVSTIESLKNQYNFKESISELFWLYKYCSAISQTGANCFIVHYEDWFLRGEELAKEIIKHTMLEDKFSDEHINNVINKIVKPSLNRSCFKDYNIQNKHVLQLYNVLKKCNGKNINHDYLVSTVKECLIAIDGFKGWYQLAHEVNNDLSNIRRSYKRKIRRLEADIKKATEIQNSQIKRNEKLSDRIEYLNDRIEINNKTAEQHKETIIQLKKKEKHYRKKYEILQNSILIKIKALTVDAVYRPGKNTILLPIRFTVLLFNYLKMRIKRLKN